MKKKTLTDLRNAAALLEVVMRDVTHALGYSGHLQAIEALQRVEAALPCIKSALEVKQ